MIFFSLQKVLFSHPYSYNIKKSDIREAPTLSTGAHSSNNTINILKLFQAPLHNLQPFFWSHVCHVLSVPVPCQVSCVICHLSLTIMTTSTNLPLLTFPLSTIGLSTEGQLKKRKNKQFTSLKSIKLKKISKIVSLQAKISDMSFGCFAMAPRQEVQWPLVYVLDFVKDVWKVKVFNQEPKKQVFFCKCFFQVTVHHKTVHTNVTFTT